MRALARLFLNFEYRFAMVDAYLASHRGDSAEVIRNKGIAHRAQADLRWRMK